MPSKAWERFHEIMEEGVEAVLMVVFFSIVVLIPYLSATGADADHPWLGWALGGLAAVMLLLVVLSRFGPGREPAEEVQLPRLGPDEDGDGEG